MKRLLQFLVVLLIGLVCVLVFPALRPASIISQGIVSDTATVVVAVDQVSAAERLAGAIRFPTVSYASGGPIDTAAFLGLHEFLATSFPRVHASLNRELVGGLSLLYTWQGTDPSLPPVVLMGHLDVVPVPEPNLPEWTRPPFSGTIADGFVWGRGTLDDKVTVLSILEATEALLGSGYRPPRTVYLAFGHDEEVGGRYGARAIVDLLVARGVKPAMVLDEGGFLASGVLPGIQGRAAIVGIAEKGYVSLKLRAVAQGGHSSMPTGRTAVGALSRAIAALEAHPFPSSLDGPTQLTLEAMIPYASFLQRVALQNLWLTGPLVRRSLQKSPMGAALLHTTIAPTMLNAGIKDNVLPPEATAVVNFRIRPGETIATVMARVREVVADSQIVVERLDSAAVDPSPVSDVNSSAYRLISGSIHMMAPGEHFAILPYLVMGGTDAKYWGAHSDRVFRFLGISLGTGDIARIHGVNERVAITDYATSVTFFARLLKGIGML